MLACAVLGLAACGSDGDAESSPDSAPSESDVASTTDAPTTTAPATTAPATTIAPTTVPPTTAPATTAAPTTAAPSTAPPTTLPPFPPPIAELFQGIEAWAVVLAGSPEFNAEVLLRAQDDAAAAGYNTGFTDCTVGASTALGMADSGVYTVSVLFGSEADARAAAEAFAARGVDTTVALVQQFCLDD